MFHFPILAGRIFYFFLHQFYKILTWIHTFSFREYTRRAQIRKTLLRIYQTKTRLNFFLQFTGTVGISTSIFKAPDVLLNTSVAVTYFLSNNINATVTVPHCKNRFVSFYFMLTSICSKISSRFPNIIFATYL